MAMTIDPAYMAYAASKGGVVALTRSIARAYGKEGIRAFVLAPGFTRTDMAQDFIDTYGEAHAAGDIALERLTEPGDVAPLAVLLASGLADHVTGCTIDVNAGSYVHWARAPREPRAAPTHPEIVTPHPKLKPKAAPTFLLDGL